MFPVVLPFMFDFQTTNVRLSTVNIGDTTFRVGSRVRLLPRAGGDIFDVALLNKNAIIESIEQDFEDNIHFAVVLDDDPGRDIGLHHHIGHRFYFRPDEVALLNEIKILIAGIGNIFLGDDGFGVEVIRQLWQRENPAQMVVQEFGIRGFDLGMALAENHDAVILVDALSRGGMPGDIFLLEPDWRELDENTPMDAHELTPLHALAMGKRLGAKYKQVFVVGCEPLSLAEQIGLSEVVQRSIPTAISMIDALAQKLCTEFPK